MTTNSNSRILSRLLVAACAIALAHLPNERAARAQTPADMASRRALLEQAQKARDDGRHTEALDLAERAGAIKMTASVRRFIAEEQSSLGRFAEALGSADQCIQEANQEASTNAAAVRAGCIDLRDQLKTKVGEVVIVVGRPPLPGLVVKVGGSVVNAALYGVGYVVTPGHIVVEATAPGYEPLRKEVDIAAGGSERIAIELAPSAPNAKRPEAPKEEPKPKTPGGVDTTTTGRAHNPVWLAVAGGGVVLAGVGTILWFTSDGKYSDLKTRCTAPTPCDPSQASSDKSSIQTLDTFATIGIVGGAVVAAAGATLYFALTHEEAKITPQVGVAHGGATVGLGGSF